MAYAQKLAAYISPEDYLLLEDRAATKHEYLGGVIYDRQGGGPSGMAGGSKDHNRVSLNVCMSLRQQLKGGPCEVFVADVRLFAPHEPAYFYPDVVVSCSAADRARALVVQEPVVIVEVLSPSTELFDRGDKFKVYKGIDSLQACVLVSPERRSIEVFTRQLGWAAAPGADELRLQGAEVLPLGLHGLTLLAADVFDGL